MHRRKTRGKQEEREGPKKEKKNGTERKFFKEFELQRIFYFCSIFKNICGKKECEKEGFERALRHCSKAFPQKLQFGPNNSENCES